MGTQSTQRHGSPAHDAADGRPRAAREIVVIGAGMVAHRFVEALCDRDPDGDWHVTVLGDEGRLPYDRVALTSFFSGVTPAELTLGGADGGAALASDPRVTVLPDARATAIHRDTRTVTSAHGAHSYDTLVLATGSSAAVPPFEGTDLPGVFVYRTLDDVAALRTWVADRTEHLARAGEDRPLRGAVVGGGLLGLEAAGALQALGARSTVVEFADRLMALQVDAGGGESLRRLIAGLGIDVRTNTATSALLTADPVFANPAYTQDAPVSRMRFASGEEIDVDVVVLATGIRARDELAWAAGLDRGHRGGVVVDSTCRTSDPDIWAIGEVACIEGGCVGLVAPGNAMAEIVVDQLLGGDSQYAGTDLSTKLKLLGVDVASFGDAFATTPGALEVVYADPIGGTYKKLVMSDDAKVLLGGILVGDASSYASLRPMVGRELGADPAAYLVPEGLAGAAPSTDLPDDVVVCSCNNVTAGTVRQAVANGASSMGEVKMCTKAGATCGSCIPLVSKIIDVELRRSGVTVSKALCEHFAMSRSQLFDAVRVTGLRTFSEIIARHGVTVPLSPDDTSRGCIICKPVVASILSSLDLGHVLDKDQGHLQDTNDHLMANMQKDGSYSVIPRVPGGEITPEKLLTIAEVARDYGLYTRITGGQRIAMFGARIEQLPDIWRRLVDAGFESGQAYGKSLRTVKSCVGSTWCRFGVQDSAALAVKLEMRYRGLRSPHKFKLGVSGCARECAEARGKDVGVIATLKGWNLYVGGNGGFTPRHADLLAEDLTEDELYRAIDRFLMYYIRTAERLQRTASWVQEVDGGLDGVKQVIFEDSLGICADLDEAMATHVERYEDEWAATLEDPEKLARFVSFVNAPKEADPDLAYIPVRGQVRPAAGEERDSETIAHTPLGARS